MRPRQVISDLARNVGFAKPAGDIMSTWLRPALEFTQHHAAVIDMVNESGLQAIQANEAKSTHDLLAGKKTGQLLLIAEAVLQREDSRLRSDERGEQLGKLAIGGRFEGYNDEVGGADSFGRSSALWPDAKIALRAAD